MLNFAIKDNGLVFTVSNNLNFSDWKDSDYCIYYLPLSSLVDNGFATIHNDECIVPFEYIYKLDDNERQILGIPEKYDKAIRLNGNGILKNADFRYQIEYLSHVPDGDILPFKRYENILIHDDNKYLLSEEQYELVKAIDTFNSTEESKKTSEYNFRCFAEIKKLALNSGCSLSSTLINENIYIPDKVKLEIGIEEGGYTLDPSIDIPENKEFQRIFYKAKNAPNGAYPVSKDNGERVRVLLSPEQRNSLEYLKSSGNRYKTKEEIQKIIESPTEFFDPDLFDISEFYSDRVIEIGIYKPKFYPFISPYKSCWVAGATVETPENGTTKIRINTDEDLLNLKEAIKEAIENNNSNVSFNNTQINIEDAKFLANIAGQQLGQPYEPIGEKISGRKVLIIEENADDLGFKVQEIINSDNKYTLSINSYLQNIFQLKEHQKEGVAWLQYLYKYNASGCLMADDMGLGKTLQILYFIDWHSRTYKNHKPYLIVAPISLLENWENEYKRFFMAPRMNINCLTSKDIPRQFDKSSIAKMQKMDIILTNYESLRTSQLNFCAVDFDVVVLDEAQKIKTPGTFVTNAAKAIKSKFKIAMTGTPVENSLLDLWCIMDFCVPGLLGNAKSFAEKYQAPLKKEDTDLIALGNEIHKELGLYFMRRLKKDVAKDLPTKKDMKLQIQMPSNQENTYIGVLDSYKNGNQINMLQTILGIKEVSEHPYLYDKTLLEHEVDELINASARIQATIMFLDKIKESNEKVIIFAERKETQKMLQKICMSKYNIIPKIINGEMPTINRRNSRNKESRQNSIDEFQCADGFNVIIMSPIAAGMGLNVVAANHVIHYSRHWNPAKESQATDRAYRIGQTKDVFVYYPMAVSRKFKSFDETLDDLLYRKTELATSTIFPTEKIEVTQEEFKDVLFKDII